MRITTAAALALACLGAPMALTAPAFAVGGLVPMETQPNRDERITQSPAEVMMEFGQDVDPSKTGFTVTDAHGRNVGVEPSKLSKTDKRMFSMGVRSPLPAGTYKVEWHATAPDGEKAHGSYDFTVTTPPRVKRP